jgi:hypothetical protein
MEEWNNGEYKKAGSIFRIPCDPAFQLSNVP